MHVCMHVERFIPGDRLVIVWDGEEREREREREREENGDGCCEGGKVREGISYFLLALNSEF